MSRNEEMRHPQIAQINAEGKAWLCLRPLRINFCRNFSGNKPSSLRTRDSLREKSTWSRSKIFKAAAPRW